MNGQLEFIKILNRVIIAFSTLAITLGSTGCNVSKNQTADTILFNGKIITVDNDFSICEAIAIKDGKIIALGEKKELLRYASHSSRKIDLQGHTVIPGLIEGHVHPIPASRSEYFHKIPDLHTISDLLGWISKEAAVKSNSEWIIHPKFFASRLLEMRQPTLAELDSVAADNPVFLNGSYGGMVNSVALAKSGILPDTEHPAIMKDPTSGNLTGLIRRSAFNLLQIESEDIFSNEQSMDALKHMLQLYNKVGITSITAGSGSPRDLEAFKKLREGNELTVRVFQNMMVPFDPHAPQQEIKTALKDFPYKTGDGDEWIKVGALKVILDGGILTGTAYLREPWGSGARDIYGVTDPHYRGVLNLKKEELVPIISFATELGWKFTAHVTGGGGVDMLLAAYEEANTTMPLNTARHSIIHGNFFTPESIKIMSDLGIYADMQAAWYLKDADLLHGVLGKERLKHFHPYQSLIKEGVIINGGSDHMVKYDSYTSINPYNPFLAMWCMITHKTERGSVFYSDEAISRKEALKIYTINNAYASFEENIKGSIEIGKVADLAVLSDDIITCPVDIIKDIHVLLTIVDGKIVYSEPIFDASM